MVIEYLKIRALSLGKLCVNFIYVFRMVKL